MSSLFVLAPKKDLPALEYSFSLCLVHVSLVSLQWVFAVLVFCVLAVYHKSSVFPFGWFSVVYLLLLPFLVFVFFTRCSLPVFPRKGVFCCYFLFNKLFLYRLCIWVLALLDTHVTTSAVQRPAEEWALTCLKGDLNKIFSMARKVYLSWDMISVTRQFVRNLFFFCLWHLPSQCGGLEIFRNYDIWCFCLSETGCDMRHSCHPSAL